MNIDTGGQYGTSDQALDCSQRPTSTGYVIFGPTSDSNKSDVIQVNENTMIVISAYIPEGSDVKIYTNRVVLGASEIPSGKPCAPCSPGITLYTKKVANILFSARMTIGPKGTDGWTIQDGQLQMVIGLPGTYQFEINNEVYLPDIWVEYSVIKTMPVNIPKEYNGGYLP